MSPKKQSLEVVEASNCPLPAGFLTQIAQCFDHEGQTIYKGRNEIKIFTLPDRTVCVKKYSVPPIFNRILYSCGLRVPKARRTYENAHKILERGFRTPVQYGYVLTWKNGWLGESYSVGEYVEHADTCSDAYTDKPLRDAFAGYTADLHAHGMMHRDYILNNILYKRTGDHYEFTLIDINRFVFKSSPIRGFLQRMNLMQPFHNNEELQDFVSAYCRAAQAPTSLCAHVLSFRRWRNRYSTLKRVLKKIPGSRWLTQHRSSAK
ncbi:MAG: lipopolysaccharide kinase InaA family protein [Elusimicrobiaceae bacterium]|nr:lipopolysaccharide kinase InaA family protein [Elusimicrobiaceae bacterium]